MAPASLDDSTRRYSPPGTAGIQGLKWQISIYLSSEYAGTPNSLSPWKDAILCLTFLDTSQPKTGGAGSLKFLSGSTGVHCEKQLRGTQWPFLERSQAGMTSWPPHTILLCFILVCCVTKSDVQGLWPAEAAQPSLSHNMAFPSLQVK